MKFTRRDGVSFARPTYRYSAVTCRTGLHAGVESRH
jgi:hypothetical protein